MKRSTASGKFALKPVVVAVALATGAAWAAPTPNQMPGAGRVEALSLAGQVQVNGSGVLAVGTTITGLANGSRIDVYGKVVLNWGITGLLDPTNPHGFNLGSNATLFFGAVSGGGEDPPAVLNVDVSGNPSQIYGNLISTNTAWANCGLCNTAPAIFLANANGIVVGAGGRIVAPTGVGLIGADMTGATSINEFIGNNGWVIPAAPSYGNSYVSFGTIPATGNVTIAGAINGDFVVNKEALYILVAGNNIDVLNTGNLFGRTVVLSGGLVAAPTLQAVGGLSSQTVNRLFDVDAGNEEACCGVGTASGDLAIVPGITGNVVNEGSISVVNGVVDREWISIQATGNVRSGIQGDGNTLVGLFADRGIEIDLYSDTGKVELYNVVSGYTSSQSLLGMVVNRNATYSGFAPDVTIDALTPGAQASSIASRRAP
mgnify:CR=1 FL=1